MSIYFEILEAIYKREPEKKYRGDRSSLIWYLMFDIEKEISYSLTVDEGKKLVVVWGDEAMKFKAGPRSVEDLRIIKEECQNILKH